MKPPTPPTAGQFLLADMEKHGGQSSWDWEADRRFAEFIGDTEAADMLNRAIKSEAVDCFRFAAARTARHVTRKRLRVLNDLRKRGLVDSGWIGTQEGGRNTFGVGRIRAYYPTQPKARQG